MKQTGNTDVTPSKKFIRRNLWEFDEGVKKILKFVPFWVDDEPHSTIDCKLKYTVIDRKLYVTKESVKSEIRRLINDGNQKYPNSVIVTVRTN